MIKYKLVCKNCNNAFDSWFASSKEYEKLRKLKHLNCHFCNSVKVDKSLMAPSVVNSKDNSFSVVIIPYTFKHTNLHTIKIGAVVNIEFDILGKYISKLFIKNI